jgi:hypothetical protein
VGVPVPEVRATVAVKVTDPPDAEGFGVEPSDVVVPTRPTTWVTTVEVLAPKEPETPW